MAKKSIGIDIGRSHLRAVQMVRTNDGYRVERAFGIQLRRSTDSPVNVLRALTTKHGFDRRAEVAVCLPHHAVFFADTKVDTAALQRLRAGDTSAFRDDFPIAAEKAVVQVCSIRQLSDDQFAVLVAATSSDLLEEELSLLGEGKLQPTSVETSITAAQTAIAFNHPESQRGTALILCVEQTALNLAVIHDAHLLAVRNIPLLMPRASDAEAIAQQITDVLGREVEITWRRLFDAEPDAELRVFLVSQSKSVRYLAGAIEADVNCRVTPVDPYAGMDQATTDVVQFPICVAEGLALRKLMPAQAGTVNFLVPRQSRDRSLLSARKELLACGGLLAATVLVWIAGLFLHLSRLESRYSRVKEQIDEVFRQTLPEERNIVSPLAQLQQKLDAFDADTAMLTPFRTGRRTPLEVLRLLSTHQPAQGQLTLDDLVVAADAVRVTGSCNSFATCSDWQRTLAAIPGFHNVEVPRQEKDPKTGKVHFTLSLSSGRTVQ